MKNDKDKKYIMCYSIYTDAKRTNVLEVRTVVFLSQGSVWKVK